MIRIMVSILVLMDLALQTIDNGLEYNNRMKVSILVLMDLALQLYKMLSYLLSMCVSILVLMDLSLQHIVQYEYCT